MSRIVVGVDGSDQSIAPLEWALDEGNLRKAEVEVVLAYGAFPDLSIVGVLSAEHEMAAHADEILRKMVEPLAVGRPGARVIMRAVQGPPAERLLAAAAGADLLVVGTRGHGGLSGVLLGSVSQRCVHHATCPVVVVPS